jgi:TnpA family transposase
MIKLSLLPVRLKYTLKITKKEYSMTHRPILTERQRNDLIALPTDNPSMLTYYILSDEDIIHIKQKRDDPNQLGFALQLCALRYPGRYLNSDDILPKELIDFIGAQLGLSKVQLLNFTYKSVTRYEHLRALQQHYGYCSFHRFKTEFVLWLKQAAIETRNNSELAVLFVEECRKRKIILPGITVIERLCADARVAAEREIVGRIVSRLDERMKKNLHAMLEETVGGRLTTHGWLKRFEVGHNSADVNRLLEKLEYLQKLDIPESLLDGIPAHRVIWLQQQGEAYYADGLRDIKEERQMAILATCATQWKSMIVDAVLETHDRIVGKVYNDCKRMRDDQLTGQKKLANETLISFVKLGKKLLKAHAENMAVTDVIQDTGTLKMLMTTAKSLTKKLESDPLEFVLLGYGRFRRYTQRLLENVIFEGNQAAQPLLNAIELLKELNQSEKQKNGNLPVCFANPKWCKRLGNDPERKLWETAILFSIRDSLRSRDIWVSNSHTYQDTRQQLLPRQQAEQTVSLSIPLQPDTWIVGRQALLEQRIKQVSQMIRQGTLPNSYIGKGKIHVNRLERQVPEGMDALTLDIYKQMPEVSITDILVEVNEDTGLTDSFIHLHTGSPCSDKVGLLNVLLAGGINMGLNKMALCSSSHTSVWSLMRISSWYVTSESITEALAVIIERHKNLPLSAVWGDGMTSSSVQIKI